MSNETKRDVFKIIADKCAGYDDELYKQYLNQYDDALPDNLPVIPKVVGEYIRAKKRKNTSQSVYYLLRDTGVLWRRKKESKILSYMHDDPDTFARAWLLGVWRVKETGEIVKLEEIDDGD